MGTPVLEAVNVTKHFTVRDGVHGTATVRAVEDATVRLYPGQIVALVGESGSGKTTLARYYAPTSGEVRLHGHEVGGSGRAAARRYHRHVQLIFQDPFSALNPLHRVRHNLERALRLHHQVRNRRELDKRVLELLERVSLVPAVDYVDKFPHELSGGQRQRVVIARALAVQPEVLLGDEPISMLDVSIRLDMLNLLEKLRAEDGLALLYITHDIASARYLCDEVDVMYAGQMVECGPAEQVIASPRHPYTQLLIESSPDPDRPTGGGSHMFAEPAGDLGDLGDPPSLIDPPSGCRFHPRCPFAMDVCRTDTPPRTDVSQAHWVRCWLHVEGQAGARVPGGPAQQTMSAPRT